MLAARRVRAGPDHAGALVEGWLRLNEPGRPEAYHPLNPGVDAGEASCIALALGRRQQGLESLLILDDRAGRTEARRLDLELTGTAAVVAMARLRGLIPAAGPVLQELRGNGYFPSPRAFTKLSRQPPKPQSIATPTASCSGKRTWRQLQS